MLRLSVIVIFYLLGLITVCHAETFIGSAAQPDKVGHYAMGATITAASSIVIPGQYAPEWGLALATTAGIAKEYYDSKHRDKHKVEVADAGATMLGGALVYAALKSERWQVIRDKGKTLIVYAVK